MKNLTRVFFTGMVFGVGATIGQALILKTIDSPFRLHIVKENNR